MLRDAAFHNMVMGVTTDRGGDQSRNFSGSQRRPGPSLATHLASGALGSYLRHRSKFRHYQHPDQVLFAYDYVGRSAFTQSELDTMDRWFFDAADYWRRDMEVGMDGVFVDRWNGDYTRTEACCNTNIGYVRSAMVQPSPTTGVLITTGAALICASALAAFI